MKNTELIFKNSEEKEATEKVLATFKGKKINENIDYNNIEGFKKSPYGLYESACTLNHSWGYSLIDNDWKSSKEILNNRIKLEKLEINYLINIGLDYLGRIPYKASEILEEVQNLYKNYKN